jgi:hypothetical protein
MPFHPEFFSLEKAGVSPISPFVSVDKSGVGRSNCQADEAALLLPESVVGYQCVISNKRLETGLAF